MNGGVVSPSEVERDRREAAAPVVAAVAATAAVAVWSVGLARAWEWDEAYAIGSLVRTPSVKSSVAAGGYANHVLMSVLESILYRATGSTSELVARLIPVAFGAGTVALLAIAACRRYGVLAASGAVALFVANPLVFEQIRQIRGYAAVTFFAFASTLLLLHLLRTGSWSRWLLVAYGALVALGLAAHLYMIGALVLQFAVVLGRDLRVVRKVLPAWVVGGALGLAANAVALAQGNEQVTERAFAPSFPLDLGRAVLGSQPLAVVATCALLAAALPTLLRRRDVQAALAAVALLVVVEWLVLQPVFLYPRFFIWLVPLVALGVAAGIDRARALRVPVPLLGAVVALTVVAQAAVWLPDATEDHYANRAASDAIAPAVASGAHVCTERQSRQLMRAYRRFDEVATDEELQACDVVIVLTENIDASQVQWSTVARNRDDIERVRRRFATRHELAARVPGALYTNAPPGCLTSPTPSCWPAR